MNEIKQLETNKFYLESRGNKMTLAKESSIFGDFWRMYTQNASQRAYRTIGAKDFASLAEVEKHYKSWQGIADLVCKNS